MVHNSLNHPEVEGAGEKYVNGVVRIFFYTYLVFMYAMCADDD